MFVIIICSELGTILILSEVITIAKKNINREAVFNINKCYTSLINLLRHIY